MQYGISTLRIKRRLLKMTIENRNLAVGTKLIARYHKESHSCEVVQGDNGKLKYRLTDGREFKSPSAAGMAITGHACDGWVFWSVATLDVKGVETTSDTTTLQEATNSEQVQEQTENTVAVITDAKPDVAKKSGTYRMRNQKGAPDGKARWFCYDCAEPFNVPASEKHALCPNKHSDK
jgi:hypothetical protein